MSEKIVQLNEEVIKGQLKELVRGSVCRLVLTRFLSILLPLASLAFHHRYGSLHQSQTQCFPPIHTALSNPEM